MTASIVAASICNGKPIYTFQLRYWRAIHGELMTHRAFSRNASSSRAIPVKKMRAQVWHDPAGPRYWGSNQAGMQAGPALTGWKQRVAGGLWKLAGRAMCGVSWIYEKLGVHKQWANRLLEPWQYITVLLTTTDLENFWELRRHPDAQPEFQDLANEMWDAVQNCVPVERKLNDGVNSWHLPFVRDGERSEFQITELLKFSGARCARTSYLTHDGLVPSPNKDIELFNKLIVSKPAHASPVEHQAEATGSSTVKSGNFTGWYQYRKLLGL